MGNTWKHAHACAPRVVTGATQAVGLSYSSSVYHV